MPKRNSVKSTISKAEDELNKLFIKNAKKYKRTDYYL